MTSIPNTSHPSWSFLRLRDRGIPTRSWFRLDLMTWPRNYEMLIHVANGIKGALQWRWAIALMSFVYVRNLLLYFVMCKYSHITKLHLGFPRGKVSWGCHYLLCYWSLPFLCDFQFILDLTDLKFSWQASVSTAEVASVKFPAFLPRDVELLREPVARNMAARIQHLPVEVM